MEKHLHIVCHDVPYPVNYGGVFDLFYKIQTLYEEGIHIHLHCFEYGRGVQPELNRYCADVRYYHRRKGHKGISMQLPYIVCSRYSEQLVNNLLKDDHPILLEGIHCSFILHDERFQLRTMALRLHNVEYLYYRQLFKASSKPFKKLYYLYESSMLKRYEKSIARKVPILCVSQNDVDIYRREFHATDVRYLPVFLPYRQVCVSEGTGCFCLYHGNLSVDENEKAAIFLIKKVFNDLNIPFVVAGKNPSNALRAAAEKNSYIHLIADPSEKELQDMIRKAQINILPTFVNTGVKLKLLNALFNGRHCVVNEATVEGTGLESACHIADSESDFKALIRQLFNKPFTSEIGQARKCLLGNIYDNRKNAQTLIQSIW